MISKRKSFKMSIAIILAITLLVGTGGTFLPVQAVESSISRTQTGTDYYFDSSEGDDNQSGLTPNQAWKTLNKIADIVFQAGDRILLRAGSEFTGGIIRPQGSGTKENPILIDMYEGDTIGINAGKRPAIHGGVHIGDHNFQGAKYATIWLENVDYWTINNLEITNYGETTALRAGVYVTAQSMGLDEYIMRGIHLNNLYVHDVNGDRTHKDDMNGGIVITSFGYWIGGEDGTDQSKIVKFDDILVENCYVKDVSRTGISVGCSTGFYKAFSLIKENPDDKKSPMIYPEGTIENYANTRVVIRNNYVERTGGDGIVVQHSDKPLVERNICAFASQSTIDDPYGSMVNAGIWTWQCKDALFQYNEVYGTVESYDGEAYDCDYGVGAIYQYNYSHDNEGGFMLLCDGEAVGSIIRYNISQNDRRSLFFISSPDGEIYNNTFYIGPGLDTGVVSAYKGAGGDQVTMQNNIFYNLGTNKGWTGIPNPDMIAVKEMTEDTLEAAVVNNANINYNNNLYYGYDSNLIPNDSNRVIADPLFVDPGKGKTGTYNNPAIASLDGYQLQSESAAIGAGIFIGNNGGKDYFGNPVGIHTPDIGAYQTTPVSEMYEAFVYSDIYETNQLKKAIYVHKGEPDYITFINNLITSEDTEIVIHTAGGDLVESGRIVSGMKVIAVNSIDSKSYIINVLEAEKNEQELFVFSDVYTIDQSSATITVDGESPDIELFSSNLRLTAGGKFKVLGKYGENIYIGKIKNGMIVHADNENGFKNYTIYLENGDTEIEIPEGLFLYSDVYKVEEDTNCIIIENSNPDFDEFISHLRVTAGGKIQVLDNDKAIYDGMITTGMVVHINDAIGYRNYQVVIK